MKKMYKWRDGFRAKGLSAEAVGSFFNDTEKKHGALTPEIVLKQAEAKSSPIHSYFDWDNTVAAQQWRKTQASELLRAVKVVVRIKGGNEKKVVRAFVRVSRPDEHSGDYVSMSRVLKRKDWKAELLEQAQADLRAFRDKYTDLQEVTGVIGAIDSFLSD